jgi:hypothetical protein
LAISFVANKSVVEASISAVTINKFPKAGFFNFRGVSPERLKAQLATMIKATWLAGMINNPL